MNATIKTTTQAAPASAVEIARSLRSLYFTRVTFSVIWVTLTALFAKTNIAVAYTLLIIYPAWDVFATYLDIKANPQQASKTPQLINVAIGVGTTAGVTLALQRGVPAAIMVFGAWAIVTGLIQLLLGLRRRKVPGGQWPMIVSGGQSVLAGAVFMATANMPGKGIDSLAGYSAFGAFYFLLSALRLSKTIRSGEQAGRVN